MPVIERAEQRLQEEAQRERTMIELGKSYDSNDLLYWAAYLDGARAQMRELTTYPSRKGEDEQKDRFVSTWAIENGYV